MTDTASARAQCAGGVLMLRPAAFGANPETAASNAFQQVAPAAGEIRAAALAEFDAFAAALAAAGVEVLVVEDTRTPETPDAVFPNNWVSLHHDGTAVLYPMLSPLRRLERRADVIDRIRDRGFAVDRVLDLTSWESRGVFLEGTGSIVFDHVARVAYACLSPRTQLAPLEALGAELGYVPHVFEATGPAGEPIYHTNVMMSVGPGFATVCRESLPDEAEGRDLVERLRGTGREILEIDRPQMNAFAGNLLAVSTARGEHLVVMSASAWKSLDNAQRRVLERHGRILVAAVPTIERCGGGSVRCMLAEVFLPRSRDAAG